MRRTAAICAGLALSACGRPVPDRTAEVQALQAQVNSLTAELNRTREAAAHPAVAAELVVNDGKDSFRQSYTDLAMCEQARQTVLQANETRKARRAEYLAQNPAILIAPEAQLAEAMCLPH